MATSTVDTAEFNQASFETHLKDWIDLPWLQAIKRDNWKIFEALPLPKRSDELWRYSSVRHTSLEGFQPATEPSHQDQEELLARSNFVKNYAGRLVFADNYLVKSDPIDEALAQQGVIWMSIEDAFYKHPDIIQKYLFDESSQLGSDKFLALHHAFFRGGSLLYVPKNVTIDTPFLAYYWASDCEESVFPHTLLIAEDNAKVNFVDFYNSRDPGCCPSLACGVGKIYAGPGAHVHREIVQNWNEQTISFQIESNFAKRDANIKTTSINLGSRYARLENQLTIEEPGADVKVYGLTVATDDREFDQRTLQIHNADNSFSDLLFKNALLDNSKTIFSGLIKVAENAQKTDAYQTNRNLLLSPKAEACSMPGLEIEANDVKCSHGSTTGQLDTSELFYMKSRGIREKAALELLVFGFFEEILEKIDNEELAASLRELVRDKFKTESK